MKWVQPPIISLFCSFLSIFLQYGVLLRYIWERECTQKRVRGLFFRRWNIRWFEVYLLSCTNELKEHTNTGGNQWFKWNAINYCRSYRQYWCIPPREHPLALWITIDLTIKIPKRRQSRLIWKTKPNRQKLTARSPALKNCLLYDVFTNRNFQNHNQSDEYSQRKVELRLADCFTMWGLRRRNYFQ
jgi:hypothetical protein